jgi:Fungal specific transcription factor domain
MPKTATRSSQGHKPEAGTGKAGFLFVSVTGEHAQPDDRKARKVIRTHVMRNYLEHTSDDPLKTQLHTIQPVPAHVVGQKMRFRLKKDKLEQSLPLRSRAKPVTRPKGAGERKERENRAAVPVIGFQHEFEFSTQSTAKAREPQISVAAPSQAFEENPLLAWIQNTSALPPDPFEDPFSSLDQEVELALPTSPLRWFGNSRIDPLGVLPVQLTAFDEVLVDRFQNYMPESWCPVSGQSAWFPFAVNDALLFHATLYNWAMHFANAAYDGAFAAHAGVIRHKLIAIHMINEKLSDPLEAVRDESLGAVVAIINAEVAYGSAEESARHMAGLRAMIDMRGGIEMLGDGIGGLLQRLVGWTDLNYAELHNAPLIFTKENCDWDRVRADAGWSCPSCFSDAPKGPEPLPSATKQTQVIPLLREIRGLCEEVARRPLLSMPEHEKMKRSDRFHALERRLRIVAERSTDEKVTDAEHRDDLVWRSCASAGLLYVHHVLRGLPLAYRQFDTLCQDLLFTLTGIADIEQAWNFAPELLLWVLSVGTILTCARPQYNWFVDSLAAACATFGYVEWTRYRDAIQSFLWVDKYDDERYLSIWQAIEDAKARQSTDTSFTTMLDGITV